MLSAKTMLCAAGAFLGGVAALPEDDYVATLDQFSFEKFNMYSGYLDLDESTKQIHYAFVDSQNNNATDPLLIWLNGGPGCSSMLGFLQENGPFVMEDGGTTFNENKWSWNTFANVLFIEQPAGVGYSYCNSTEDCYSDDLVSSEDNLEALLKWFEKFPEYKEHELYISGESYAGIYVPYFMWQIDQHNANQTRLYKDDAETVNLKGMLVGNGVTNWTYDTMPATIELLYWRSLIDQELHDSIKAAECDYATLEFDPSTISEECMGYLTTVTDDYIAKINIYNIYGQCYGATEDHAKEYFDYELNKMRPYQTHLKQLKVSDGKLSQTRKFATARDYTPWMFAKKGRVGSDGVSELPPCTFGQPIIDYLNNASVKEQLHIPEYVQAWDLCKDNINYTMFFKGSQFIWEELRGKYRMLKYSGDMDASVPTLGTVNWITALGWETKKEWRQYKVDGEVNPAGWVQNFDGLDLATVHGAGHMVPQDKRMEAHFLIKSYLFKTGPFEE